MQIKASTRFFFATLILFFSVALVFTALSQAKTHYVEVDRERMVGEDDLDSSKNYNAFNDSSVTTPRVDFYYHSYSTVSYDESLTYTERVNLCKNGYFYPYEGSNRIYACSAHYDSGGSGTEGV